MIAIIMGSDSDLPVMSKAAEVLDKFELNYHLTIVSAHRTPDRMYKFAKEAEEKGIKVIIAGAGGAAHLPGMVASLTHLPVIGVPIKTSSLNGLDSLLSIVQMPAGIPVATVAINNAENAALLALSILATSDENIAKKLKEYKEGLKNMVESKAQKLEDIGYKEYISQYLSK
ncbi:MAG: 5-(carboxyamino)imidazole ribonucleotide mutase [Hydrogenothermaceae bacterium]|nr:5-(carboxyamino)imidazole ribonucleotide mutase [Hydrogenothermaceae bacterium]